MDCDEIETEATKTIGNETNIEKHIQNLKDYIRIDKENINYDDSDFAQFCKSHCEDIQAVLDELDNRIPRKDIEERLNKLKNKQKELDEEGFYGRYKKYGGKQKFKQYYAYINGTIQAYEELLNKE